MSTGFGGAAEKGGWLNPGVENNAGRMARDWGIPAPPGATALTPAAARTHPGSPARGLGT